MRIDIATLFTEMCDSVLRESIVGRGIKNGHIEIYSHDIRKYTENKHRRVDDKPYGGGTGMLMQAQPVFDCISAIKSRCEGSPRIIYMSPQGETLTQEKVRELAAEPWLILLCGHYEGIDRRVLDELEAEELSVGDYVLTGGELPALIVADAVARLQPGVLPNEDAYSIESHYNGLLEYPQYTRPEEWHRRKVPEALLTGDHRTVAEWQRREALRVTAQKRPDMYEKFITEQHERLWSAFLSDKGMPQETRCSGAFRFGETDAEADRLLKLALRGKKRAHTSVLHELQLMGEKLPERGEYRIAVDSGGIGRCVVQTFRVTVLPFCEVTEELCRREGEESSAEEWRSRHRTLFLISGERRGYDFNEETPVVFHEFRLLYKYREE